MGGVDIRSLLAGLGIIIFGMNIFEQALKVLGGNKVKGFLEKYTSNRRASVTTGFTATSILNSSTLVTLLTIAFVGAGVMQLYNAIGVILGANIGSATRSVLIAFLGFGELKISVIAMPLIAIGGCWLIFAKQEKHKMIANMLVGFGLLFLGISFMKDSVETLQASFNLAQYKDMSLWTFGIIGVVTTAVLHSSGALGIMTLAALDGGIISFPASVAINMGANVGTTFTALYASLGGRKIKRQVAMSHVMFNFLSSIIGIVFFWQYIWLTNEFLGFGDNLVVANAVLNFIFNLTTALFFACFLKSYTRFIERIVPHDAQSEKSLHIESVETVNNTNQINVAKLYALQEDTKTLIDHAFLYNSYVFGIHGHDLMGDSIDTVSLTEKIESRDKEHHIKLYHDTKVIADKLLAYTFPLKKQISGNMAGQFSRIESSITDSLKSIKSIKNIYRDIQNLAESSNPVLQDIYKQLVENSIHLYRHIAIIIDRHYDAENLEELSAALEKIKLYHNHFVDTLSILASKKKLVNEELSTLLNIDHYLFQSAHTIVEAVHHMYLTEEEATKFQNLSDMEE